MSVRSYEELSKTYKIVRYTEIIRDGKYVKIDKNDYDVIIELQKTLFSRKVYKIIKNSPNLSMSEIAVICNKGPTPHGYSAGYKTIDIFTR